MPESILSAVHFLIYLAILIKFYLVAHPRDNPEQVTSHPCGISAQSRRTYHKSPSHLNLRRYLELSSLIFSKALENYSELCGRYEMVIIVGSFCALVHSNCQVDECG